VCLSEIEASSAPVEKVRKPRAPKAPKVSRVVEEDLPPAVRVSIPRELPVTVRPTTLELIEEYLSS
jgi:hypothetical protein